MHHCPSQGMLLDLQHAARPGGLDFEPYHDYCGHCDVLYRRVLEPLGYECIFDLSETERARCQFVVRVRP